MRNLMWAALAAGFLWAGTGVASADDTVRLGGAAAEAAIQGGIDTELVRGRYGYHGGYYGRGYYGRAYYGSSYGRGYYGGGLYRPYYYSAYYRPYYYTPTYYYPQYYYNQPCYSAAPSYYYPVAGESVPPPAATLQATFYSQSSAQPPAGLRLPSNGNGTYQYDGGPPSMIPLPNPSPETNPANGPRGIIPIDGRLVSLPTQASGGTSQIGARVSQPAAAAPRVAYPAYGE